MTSRGATDRTMSVIGLGYIGLPTAIAFAANGWQVFGVDVKADVVESVNRGKLPFVEEGLEELLQKVVADGSLVAQQAPPAAQVFIVAVPTPVLDTHEADLSFIRSACDSIAPLLRGGELIVLESTSPPGTTEMMAQWIEQARPDLRADRFGEQAKDTTGDPRPLLYFAHVPERVLPGRMVYEMTQNDRIVGGLSQRATDWTVQVYSSFCRGEISVTDAKTAELAKLTENSFRDVNIAFANELSLICDKLGIDVWELIEIANHHPRVNILQPGPGVGGHCISVDPWFIVAADRKHSRLIQTARLVNDDKPNWVINQTSQAIETLVAEQKKVAVLGLSFKANVDDLRESPAIEITKRLCVEYPEVSFLAVEPNVSALPSQLCGLNNLKLSALAESLEESQIVLLLVDHRPFTQVQQQDLEGKIVIDTKGLWR